MTHTTIISDMHLGSDVCQAKDLYTFLIDIHTRTNRLILNGDVFDSIDFRRLKKTHWNILSQLRKLSDKIEIIWVNGNHDSYTEIISHLLGVITVDEYIFTSGDKFILVLHGHIFDKFIVERPVLTYIGDMLYRMLQKIDKTHYMARTAKKQIKYYIRNNKIIQENAIRYAKHKNCQIVCCGHTHYAIKVQKDVEYINSGCWTERPCTFIEIEDGIAEIKIFKPLFTVDIQDNIS